MALRPTLLLNFRCKAISSSPGLLSVKSYCNMARPARIMRRKLCVLNLVQFEKAVFETTDMLDLTFLLCTLYRKDYVLHYTMVNLSMLQ